jgi:dihydropteroate synthase
MREDSELVHVPVSVDTFHSRVAAAAVAAGADMVNDVSGGQQDGTMLSTVASLGVPYCLMHMRGDFASMTSPAATSYSCVWAEVGAALRARAAAAVGAGILPWNLVLDPGIGFSKTSEGNAGGGGVCIYIYGGGHQRQPAWGSLVRSTAPLSLTDGAPPTVCLTELLGHLAAMRREQLAGVWGRMPLLVGPSRKRFIGRLTGRDVPAQRDLGTAAACVAAVAQGADIVRVHNVPVVGEALRVADAVFRGTWPPDED